MKTRSVTRALATTAALSLVLLASACSSDASDSSDGAASAPQGQTLTVFAAASLTGTFTEMGKEFEKTHEGVTVKFSFGGSSDLVTQIQNGAPADVFASADTKNMDKAADLVDGTPVNFASNTLEIAVPPDNPAKIDSFDDLANKDIDLVICAPEVPCGAAAQKVSLATGVKLSPVSEEQSVTDVLGKVESGDADAGLVYVTDVKAAGDKVLGVTFPESSEAVNTYPIAALTDAKSAALAKEFLALVTGAEGQKILVAAGFAQP